MTGRGSAEGGVAAAWGAVMERRVPGSASLGEAAVDVRPAVGKVGVLTPRGGEQPRVEVGEDELLAVAGAGATEALASSIGAELLDGNPVTQAGHVVTAR